MSDEEEKKKEEQKDIESMNTSDLMNYVDLMEDYEERVWDELHSRPSYSYLIDIIRELEDRVVVLEEQIKQLRDHEHSEKTGRVVYG